MFGVDEFEEIERPITFDAFVEFSRWKNAKLRIDFEELYSPAERSRILFSSRRDIGTVLLSEQRRREPERTAKISLNISL